MGNRVRRVFEAADAGHGWREVTKDQLNRHMSGTAPVAMSRGEVSRIEELAVGLLEIEGVNMVSVNEYRRVFDEWDHTAMRDVSACIASRQHPAAGPEVAAALGWRRPGATLPVPLVPESTRKWPDLLSFVVYSDTRLKNPGQHHVQDMVPEHMALLKAEDDWYYLEETFWDHLRPGRRPLQMSDWRWYVCEDLAGLRALFADKRALAGRR
jgi:hypothetical protein